MMKEIVVFFCGQAFGFLLIKLFNLIKDHKKELQTNKQTFFHYEPFYVEVKTGKYFCLTDLIKEYGLDKVRHLVAYGVFINENEYEKLKEFQSEIGCGKQTKL